MSVRQRLYPDPVQVAGLVEHCHHARFVYNIGLEQRALWRRSKHDRGIHPDRGRLDAPRVTTASQMRELAVLRSELEWLRSGSSSVQQGALRDLDRAFTNFFAGRAGFPKFKKATDREGSFVVRDLTVARLNRRWGVVMIPKVGKVRFRLTKDWAEVTAATSARVTHRNQRWHVSFTTPPVTPVGAGTGSVVGIDRGVANTLALSDGTMIQAPGLTSREQARFVRLQRQLARQVKGSNRRRVTLDKLAVLRRRLDDRRRDWVEQTTTRLARDHDVIVIEHLVTANMTRRPTPKPDPTNPGAYLPNRAKAKAGLNRAILASCWASFATRLGHKLTPGSLIEVDPRNTSRTCAACGHCAPGNRESQAVFECVNCGHQAHADTNAAINILNRGTAATTNQPTPVGIAAGHVVNGRIRPRAHNALGSVNHPVMVA